MSALESRSGPGRLFERTIRLGRDRFLTATSLLRKLGRDDGGSIVLKFALAMPVVAVLVLGGVDLNAVQADRVRLQDIADAAALAGARELGLAVHDNGPEVRAMAFIEAHLAEWKNRPQTVTPSVEVITLPSGERALRAVIDANRLSFFGNLLPPGGWNMTAKATASSVSMVPLCVLAHGDAAGDALQMLDRAVVDAPLCLIHSNDRLKVGTFGRLNAGVVQSVGPASGNISPNPQTGAQAIPDPFTQIDPSPPGACARRSIVHVQLDMVLQPGLHCDDYVVTGTAELRLAAGEHYFVDNILELRGNSRLTGDDAVLVFDRAAFDFVGNARVRLSGRRTGVLAGFVIIGLRPPAEWCPAGRPPDDDDDDDDGGGAEPSRPHDCRLGSEFVMASDHVEQLDGVIYTPASKLIVSGREAIAETSDWTVMIVDTLEVRGSPRLVINADYSGSSVPVPTGAGPGSGTGRLIR